MKPSIRNYIATGKDFCHFVDNLMRASHAEESNDSCLTALDEVRTAYQSAYQQALTGRDEVQCLSLHDAWQETNAPELLECTTAALAALKEHGETIDAICQSSGIHNFSKRLANEMESIIYSEDKSYGRNRGPYWHRPIEGMSL